MIFLKVPAGDSTDTVVRVVTQLFILSMVNERIASFVKLYMYDADNWFSRFFGLFSRSFAQRFIINPKTANETAEQVRERTILIINLSLGFLIALLFKADLLTLLNSEGADVKLGWGNLNLGWKGIIDGTVNSDWDLMPGILLGCLLTGSFISLGSKFWHDLLDTILAVKNYSGKLSNPNTYSLQSAAAVQEFANLTDVQLAELALNQNIELYTPHTRQIGYGRNAQGLFCVYLHAAEGPQHATALNRLRLYVKLPGSGRIVEQPFEVVKYVPETIDVLGAASASEWDVRAGQTTGTVCCKVKSTANGSEKLLTCSHVVFNDMGLVGKGNLETPLQVELAYPGNGKIDSVCNYALRNQFYDLALIDLPKDSAGFNNVPGLQAKAPADLTGYFGKQVVILTQDNQAKTAYLIEQVTTNVPIAYRDGTADMQWLLRIGSVPDHKGPASVSNTRGGDSGSLVYYQQGDTKIPIAMIIAGSGQYSYAVSMHYNLTQTNSTIS